MTEGVVVPPKKKPAAVKAEPKPGQAKNISGDPLWFAGQTIQPDEVIDVEDVTVMPADLWETK